MVIETKAFSHCCARTQAATLTLLAYYDFACDYVANNNANFVEIATYLRDTDVSGNLTEIYGAVFVPRSSTKPWLGREVSYGVLVAAMISSYAFSYCCIAECVSVIT